MTNVQTVTISMLGFLNYLSPKSVTPSETGNLPDYDLHEVLQMQYDIELHR